MYSGSGHTSPTWPVILGLSTLGYGSKVLLTRTSYWISAWIYLLPAIAVGYLISRL